MKSRTSFFNPTVFKKDVTRFAPAWGLYTILLLMGMVSLAGNSSGAYNRTCSIVEMICVMAMMNLCYAAVNAQLLFGDLYSARLCNALHAMPLRRECWFVTHTAAGLCFSFVPNALVTLAALALMNLGIGWPVALWWLLGAALQYLFFFGVAVLCVFLVGSRFAQLVVYGILNGFAAIVYWLADSLYEPLLSGICFRDEWFLKWCPFSEMLDNYNMISVMSRKVYDAAGNWEFTEIDRLIIGDGWGYYALCAAVGVACMGLALVLYRKRKLECAGDFLAFRVTQPPFLVLFTICVGGFTHALSDLFYGTSMRYLFLAVGLVVGFFGGLMLLKRTTRVFSRKAFLRFGVLTAVLVASLVVTWLDPLGITRYVPELDEVESVELGNYVNYYSPTGGSHALTDPADIQNIIDAHEAILSGEAEEVAPEFDADTAYYWINVSLNYILKDGTEVGRYYKINSVSETGQLLKQYHSSLEFVMGISEEEIPALAAKITHITTEAVAGAETISRFQADQVEALLRAIAADCAAGNMAQNWAYHENTPGDADDDRRVAYLEYAYEEEQGYITYEWLDIYESCTNTIAWMEASGLYTPGEGAE